MKKYCNGIEGLFHNFKLSFLLSHLGSKSFKLLALSSVLSVLLIIGWLLYPDKATSGPYLESAHGDTTIGIGVLRTSLSSAPNNYGRGNCAHCHEQHRSIGGSEPAPDSPAGPDFYLLFQDLWTSPIQSKAFCYGCHTNIDSYQLGLLQNYSYSYRRGGNTTLTCPSSVFESFQFINNNGASQSNCGSTVGSSHRFGDFAPLAGKWGFSSNPTAVNPCSACHNPHKAKKEFPCSRPSAHTNIYTWEVWGDGSSERMSNKAASLGGTYCAPYRHNSTTTREPDGCSAPPTDCSTGCSNGSNLADYVSLCTDCHNSTNIINSTRLDRPLYRINWTGFGDFHGGRTRIDNGGDFSGPGEMGDLLEPYKSGGMPNYVLSCTDCHEPHGSPNEFLLRKTVNGIQVNTISSPARWLKWCQVCHSINVLPSENAHFPLVREDIGCFGACHRHCDGSDCSASNLF
jgi:predicted CXXCH cytochrome family protein